MSKKAPRGGPPPLTFANYVTRAKEEGLPLRRIENIFIKVADVPQDIEFRADSFKFLKTEGNKKTKMHTLIGDNELFVPKVFFKGCGSGTLQQILECAIRNFVKWIHALDASVYAENTEVRAVSGLVENLNSSIDILPELAIMHSLYWDLLSWKRDRSADGAIVLNEMKASILRQARILGLE
jgi:hypothetical protein